MFVEGAAAMGIIVTSASWDGSGTGVVLGLSSFTHDVSIDNITVQHNSAVAKFKNNFYIMFNVCFYSFITGILAPCQAMMPPFRLTHL